MSGQTALPVALATWRAADAVRFGAWLESVKALRAGGAVRVLVSDAGSHAVALPAGAELEPARDGFYRLPAGAA